MAKYSFSFSFRDEDGDYISGQGVIAASDEDSAVENISELLLDSLSVERVAGEYDVKVTVSFRFDDENGQYDDADEVQRAFEGGDESFTDQDYNIDEVEVTEA